MKSTQTEATEAIQPKSALYFILLASLGYSAILIGLVQLFLAVV